MSSRFAISPLSPLLRTTSPSVKRIFRLIGILIGFGLIAWFLRQSGTTLVTSVHVLRSANLWWVALAMACEFASLVLIVSRMRVVLRRLGYAVGPITIGRAHLKRMATSAIVPVGGVPAVALFTRDLGKGGVPTRDALYAISLSTLAGTVGSLLVMAPLMLFVPREVTLFAGAIGLVVLVLMVIGTRWRAGTDKSLRRSLVPGAIVRFTASARAHNVQLREMILPVVLAAGSNAVGVLALYASLRAVNVRTGFETLLTARGAGSLATQFSPLMQGSGLAEGSMTAILQRSVGAPAAALAGVVLFRLIQVWMPVMFGLLLFVRLPRLSQWTPSPTTRARIPGTVLAVGCAVLMVMMHMRADIDIAWWWP